MNKEQIIIPTKEEVKKLLIVAMNDKMIQMQSISELLGMKWVDSLLPKFKNEPEWGYDGLKKFFVDNEIEFSNTLETALEKLNR